MALNREREPVFGLGALFEEGMASDDRQKVPSTERSKRKSEPVLNTVMDVIFGVVVGHAISLHSGLLLAPLSSALPLLALVCSMTNIMLSWVQFRASLDRWPYERSGYAYFRFAADFLILGLYAAQLYSITDIVSGLGLYRYVSSYGNIFTAYIVSGLLRRAAHGASASRQGLLWKYWFILQVLKVAYVLVVGVSGPLAIIQWPAAILPLLVVISYRFERSK